MEKKEVSITEGHENSGLGITTSATSKMLQKEQNYRSVKMKISLFAEGEKDKESKAPDK